MFHLQRASAGSGKTYALTKTFIKLFISRKTPHGRVLRNPRELNDSIRHIMAVTFTNKATGEMKQRIVEKLSALADAENAKSLESVDYLRDFMEEFGADARSVAEICRAALKALLLNYSDFHVSTIDSFFQSILHTFAYETDMESGFNVEIDEEYVSAMGLDSVIESFLRSKGDENDENVYWLKKLMNKSGASNQWNIFRKSEARGSLYVDLIKKMAELEKEQYKKEIRELMDAYFEALNDAGITFREIYEAADSHFEGELETRYENRRKAALALEDGYTECGVTPEGYSANTKGRIEKSKLDFKHRINQDFSFTIKPDAKLGFSLSAAKKKEMKENPEACRRLDSLMENFWQAHIRYLDYKNDHDYLTWQAYKKQLPYLPLLYLINGKKQEYLNSSDTIQISDTNTLLEKIIGEDETPFIYERMGTLLNHFLIDEFQDTSKMQWQNFLPLLKDSHSAGHDNLIIGDAKQSIYRFRNADYTLITNEVEKEFTSDIILSAEDKAPSRENINTNWRSDENVVRFNNHIFSALTNLGTDKSDGRAWLFKEDIRDIYADCIQNPAKKNGRGYVEVTIYDKAKGDGPVSRPEGTEEGTATDAAVSDTATPGYAALAPLICSLRRRGYKFRDIGILTRKKEFGDMVVEKLMQHNSEHPEESISFISDQSLLLSRSPAVELIVAALEAAVFAGPDSELKESAEKNGPAYPISEKKIFELLRNTPLLTLPSVIDGIIREFLSADMRDKETPYIAAFMDLALEFAATGSNDIRSFLQWWYKNANKASITSSEETDSVRILTIHKAKGLEFKCVIIPEADYRFGNGPFPEWVWVDNKLQGFNLPPKIPVATDASLVDTRHSEVWETYDHDFSLDSLNAVYVAFTRAVNELYVFVPAPSAKKAKTVIESKYENFYLGENLDEIFQGFPEVSRSAEAEEEMARTSPRYLSRIFTFGSKLTEEEVEGLYASKNSSGKTGIREIEIEPYDVTQPPSAPKFRDDYLSLFEPPEEGDPDYDIDSGIPDLRAEGNLLHGILESVTTEKGLDSALLRFKARGLISGSQAREYGLLLRKALDSVKDYGWFSGKFVVLAERTLLLKGEKHRRPDRIMISEGGEAIVVDYKFGHHTDVDTYRSQVRRYMRLLRATGRFSGVKGYLWYVRAGKVEEVGLR